VPADDGLGLDDDQDVGPPGPKAVEGCPDEPVEGVQFGPRSLPFEHRDLLPEGEDFEGRVAATAEEDTGHGEDGEDEFRHELTLVTRCNVARAGQRLKLQGIDFKTSRSFGYTQAPRIQTVTFVFGPAATQLADLVSGSLEGGKGLALAAGILVPPAREPRSTQRRRSRSWTTPARWPTAPAARPLIKKDRRCILPPCASSACFTCYHVNRRVS
jgi:hypothetical protein